MNGFRQVTAQRTPAGRASLTTAVISAVLATFLPARLTGAEPGSEVVVIYNDRVPESKAVAEYYARKRHVPMEQLFGFSLDNKDDISRADYQEKLAKPLLEKLERSKLWEVGEYTAPATTNDPGGKRRKVVSSSIRYAVLCYGIPLRIAHDPAYPEKLEKVRPELRRNGAAVESELCLLPVLDKKPPVGGPLRNPLYGVTNAAWIGPTNGLLITTRVDGPTPEIAQRLVDKAMQAESEGLNGRAYFDLRNAADPTYKPGDDWIRAAAEICKRLGFETVIDQNQNTFPVEFPMSQIAIYMGWYTEQLSGPFTLPEVEFMPGAFAYHIHSFSAVTLHSSTKHWAGPLIAKGVTCTIGCVDEPYLSGTPEMAVFAARFFFSGMTFGEAAYAAQPALSWQITCIGDPLYRPSAKNPDQLISELQEKQDELAGWNYLRLVNANIANGKPLSGMASFLEQLGTAKQSAVLSEKLGDLYTALGKPSSAVHEYTRALSLNPSPLQKLRLLLTLGEKMPDLNRVGESVEMYKQVLKDFPEYPGKLQVYKRLQALSQKLGKSADATAYESELKRLSQ